MNRTRHPAPLDTFLVFLAVAAAATAGWVWLTGEIAGWLASGAWPRVPVSAAARVLAGLPGHLAHPKDAWPVTARRAMPGGVLLYGCGLGLLGPSGWVVVRWRVRRPAAGAGAAWARPGDLRALLTVRPGTKGRVVLGRTGRSSLRLVATEARHSVLVIGPTQSGKTTALAVPAILEWRGPVVATSVKDDLARLTLGVRAKRGPCFVFDPTASTGLDRVARWTPVAACRSWSEAQKTATALVEATPARSGLADAAFWYAAAAKQLAPLLLAANRTGATAGDLVRWTNTGNLDEPLSLLHLAGEEDAAAALQACANRDPRILSSVATTLETVLAPFEDPVVAASTSGSDIDLDGLLGRQSTLFLCGPSHEQQRVQGLFSALVSAVVNEAVGRVGRDRRPLDPPLLVVLDEAANIAPIRDLDTLASTAAGMGIQLVTVCQDLAQLAARYGDDRSRTIANNHRAKLLLSGVSDLTTLDLVSGLAGEAAHTDSSYTQDLRDGRWTRATATAFRRLAPTDQLRRIRPGHAVLVYGHLPPARIRLRPWFTVRRLRRAVDGAAQLPAGGVLRARLGATRGGSPGIFG